MSTEIKSATLEKCVDGDTANFKVNGEVLKYRFLAIDTPESVHPTKKEQEYGKTASEYTCGILTEAKEIYVETETKNKTDKYGRNLAWIWVDNELLQKKLIENGYAQVAYIYGDYKYTLNLCAVQAQAKKDKINIWSNKKYEEGYCKTVDITGVSTDITRPQLENVGQPVGSPTWIYYVILVIVAIILLSNQSWRKKIVKKTQKNVEKKIDKVISSKLK